MGEKIWNIKVYTKMYKEKRKDIWYGVIEAPLYKMMKAYPREYSFLQHETRRALDASRAKRAEMKKKKSNDQTG